MSACGRFAKVSSALLVAAELGSPLEYEGDLPRGVE